MQRKSQQLEEQHWHKGGITINIEEKRNYFREFEYEVLTSNPENKALISEFVSKKANNTLETYIRDEDKAWAEDLDGETRVYLVKDKSGNIALFFSVKCGLLVGENLEEKLSSEYEEFIDVVIEVKKSKDENSIQQMYEAGLSMYDKEVDVPLGFGIFWEIVVPIIIDITKNVGCKYIYLFAADKTEGQNEIEMRKLISHYKNNFKFSECDEGIKFIKPEYDNHCYGLIQRVSKLESNREAIWHEFSDIQMCRGRLVLPLFLMVFL